MKKHKIIISGRFFDHRDLVYINNGSLSVETFPKPALLTASKAVSLQNACEDADLLIIALFGSSPDHLSKFEFDKISIPIALWSFDSHHSAEKELKFAHNFKKLFISHSPYLNQFNGFDAEWLPCCYYRFGIDDLKKIVKNQWPYSFTDHLPAMFQSVLKKQKSDIAFPHKKYPMGAREKITGQICDMMRSRGLKVFVGDVKSGWPYMKVIKNSRIILNVSLLDDLNMRNFEAWGLDRVLLTNKVPDHDQIKAIDLSHTYFFKRNLSDFEDVLDAALSDKAPVNTFMDIINGHMLVHRYIEIINRCLKTNYEVRKFSIS